MRALYCTWSAVLLDKGARVKTAFINGPEKKRNGRISGAPETFFSSSLPRYAAPFISATPPTCSGRIGSCGVFVCLSVASRTSLASPSFLCGYHASRTSRDDFAPSVFRGESHPCILTVPKCLYSIRPRCFINEKSTAIQFDKLKRYLSRL